jgi:hypothetical protein
MKGLNMKTGRPKKNVTFWDRLDAQSHTNENGCRIFTGSRDKGGYGWVMKEGKQVLIHREVFKKHNPEIVVTGVIMHICDVRNCINPEHLKHGTQGENFADMVSKGRRVTAKGSRNQGAKLVESDIPKIRELAAMGVKHTRLSQDFGVSQTAIGRIVCRKTWSHVP